MTIPSLTGKAVIDSTDDKLPGPPGSVIVTSLCCFCKSVNSALCTSQLRNSPFPSQVKFTLVYSVVVTGIGPTVITRRGVDNNYYYGHNLLPAPSNVTMSISNRQYRLLSSPLGIFIIIVIIGFLVGVPLIIIKASFYDVIAARD